MELLTFAFVCMWLFAFFVPLLLKLVGGLIVFSLICYVIHKIRERKRK